MRNGNAHGVYLHNSNAMDVTITEQPSSTLQYKVIGGVIDLYIFVGPTPQDVVQQYQQLVGNPYFPPAWGLGFHQCRYGYKNVKEIETVVQKYKENNLPLDTIWTDIDYMDKFKTWTFDPVNYPVPLMQQFVSNLNNNHQHYIVIVDPGVKQEVGYAPYDEGMKQQVFITKNDGKTPIVNKCWPGLVVFPDFTNEQTNDYWYNLIQQFINTVGVSGLWLDMNEYGYNYSNCLN